MPMIEGHLRDFSKALQQEFVGRGQVVGNEKGHWHYESGIFGIVKRVVRRIFGLENRRVASVINAYAACLNNLERIPVNTTSANKDLELHLFFAKGFVTTYEKNRHRSKRVGRALNNLDRHVAAMQYRLGELEKTSSNDELTKTIYVKLKTDTWEWKKKQFCYKDDEKELTDREKKQLLKVAKRIEFAQLLNSDPQLFSEFMKWAVRDNCSVRVFVEYPAIQKKIKNAILSQRIGRVGRRALQVETNDKGEKEVTLPFVVRENRDRKVRRISIPDGNRVVAFNENFKLTIDQVFKVFENKKKKEIYGDLEWFEDGITNYNISKYSERKATSPTLSRAQKVLRWIKKICAPKLYEKLQWKDDEYSVIDFSAEIWWEQMPTFETLSLEEAKKQYGEHLDGTKWTVAVCAKRESIQLDPIGNHAFYKIVIPNEDGTYRVCPFGKFPKKFPMTEIQKIAFLADSTRGEITFDQNVYYTHRQQWKLDLPFSHEDGVEFMSILKKHILLGLEEDENESVKADNVFQFQWRNCANFIQMTLKEFFDERKGINVPNLFLVDVLKMEPSDSTKYFIKLVKSLPKSLRPPLIHGVQEVLMAGRTIVVRDVSGDEISRSVKTSPFWRDLKICLPAYFAHKLEKGTLQEDIKFFMNKINERAKKVDPQKPKVPPSKEATTTFVFSSRNKVTA